MIAEICFSSSVTTVEMTFHDCRKSDPTRPGPLAATWD